MIKCGSVIAKSMIRIPLIMPAITKAFGLLSSSGERDSVAI